VNLEWAQLAVFESVYEPSDDTWLLINFVEKRLKDRVLDACLDLGCGTGVIGLFLLSRGFCRVVVFSDIAESAVENTRYNILLNSLGFRAMIVASDVFGDALREESFDLIASNPPYLPGVPRESYELALLGGLKGYETILEFIEIAERILRRRGLLYIVYSSLSKPEVVEDRLSESFEIKARDSKAFFYETIYVVEAEKK